MLCCSYTVVWWLFQSLAATFTLLTSKDAPPKMKKREKRDTSGEKHHGPRNGIIWRKNYFPPAMERKLSLFGFFFWISVEDFVDLMKARKNLFQMGKLGRVLFCLFDWIDRGEFLSLHLLIFGKLPGDFVLIADNFPWWFYLTLYFFKLFSLDLILNWIE